MADSNDNLILICGESAGGKTASLKDLREPESVMYLNCEANKKCPFRAGFKQYSITDPFQVREAFSFAETKPEFKTIVIDTQTYLMDMFESLYVLGVADTMQGWSNYAQYFKSLMQSEVAKSTKNIIFLAHVQTIMNTEAMVMEKKVPVKGALQKNGIESFFSCIVGAKKVLLEKLEAYQNPLLVITPDDELLGYKYVYQTRLTKDTVNERIRNPIDMWSIKETFIDNNCQHLLDRLNQFYN